MVQWRIESFIHPLNLSFFSSLFHWFQAAEQGQEVSHHICVSHLPRLVNPGTEEEMQEHTASIEVLKDNRGIPNSMTTGRSKQWLLYKLS